MAAIPLPPGEIQFSDNNGDPLVSGTVEHYIPGTLTPKTTWQNINATITNTNPIQLDGGGRAIIFGLGAYRQILKSSTGDLIWDRETTAGTIFTNAVQYYASVAELRAAGLPLLSSTSPALTAETQWYYDNKTGEGNIYDWDESSTEADNNGTVLNPTGNFGPGRWHSRTPYLTFKQWGCAGDAVAFGATTTAGVAQVVSNGVVFTEADVGKAIAVANGDGLGTTFVSTISSYISSTIVGVATAPTATNASAQSAYFGTDDTVAAQNAIDSALSLTGGHILMTKGTYLITDEIEIGFTSGWTIIGTDRGSCFWINAGTNKATLFFSEDTTSRFKISQMSFEWVNAQPVTAKRSCALFFEFDSPTNNGWFNWQATECNVNFGRNFIGASDTTRSVIWGFRCADIVGGRNMTSGCVYLNPNPPAGSPNIKIDNIYWYGNTMAASEYVIDLAAADSYEIGCLELNEGFLGGRLLRTRGGGFGTVGSMKVENCEVTASDTAYVTVEDGDLVVGTLLLSTIEANVGTGQIYGVSIGGARGSVRVENYVIGGITFDNVAGRMYSSGSATFGQYVYEYGVLRGVGTPASPNQIWLTNAPATGGALATRVRDWMAQSMSVSVGDAAKTVYISIDAPVQRQTTTLTADRAITIGDRADGAESNMHEPFEWTFIRAAVTPGAFIWRVNDHAGNLLASLPANTNGIIKVKQFRFGNIVTHYSTWIGANPIA